MTSIKSRKTTTMMMCNREAMCMCNAMAVLCVRLCDLFSGFHMHDKRRN